MAGGSAPRLGQALAHYMEAEPPRPPSKVLNGIRKATFASKDPPVAQLAGKEKWYSTVNVPSRVLAYVHLRALEGLLGLSPGTHTEHPGAAAQSALCTGHAFQPVVIFHCCFMGYLVFCQQSFIWPSFGQMALNSTCQGWCQSTPWPSLERAYSIARTCSDASAWCIKKSICT